jgi:hypothetical protein
MLHVIESGYAPEKYDQQLLDCPACNTPALVSGSVRTDFDEDWDHHEHVLIGVHAYFTFIPSRLRCNACGLELDGRDELDAAGIGQPWVPEDVERARLLRKRQGVVMLYGRWPPGQSTLRASAATSWFAHHPSSAHHTKAR